MLTLRLLIITLTLSGFSSAVLAVTAIDRLNEFNTQVNSLSAGFKQTLYDSDGEAVQQSSGKLLIQRPNRFRWDYSKPYPQLLLADGKRFWIYDSDLEQVTVKLISEVLGNAPSMLLNGKRVLDDDFIIKDLGKKDGMLWVELFPRKSESDFRLVRLAFKKQLQIMEFEDALGQLTRIQFDNLKTNITINPDQFVFHVPKGADVVGNTE
ncbi:MAG TPA: outer membrane lipoprotein chaperone LolA [Gammaproteobacteria bacterium]|nr:outer membrane lipoprotein chaperone LolA [Gammaproteobacteria bacterium]